MLDAWLRSRSIDLAIQANQDLPPTKKEANKKKTDWPKIEKQRDDLEQFMKVYREHHNHPYFWEKYMGLNPIFEAPEGTPEPQMKRNTKEFRAQRKKQIQEMEARLIRDMRKIASVHGNIHFDQMQPS